MTTRVESLVELEMIAKTLFGARRIQLALLTRLRDAPAALCIIEALCSDHDWEVEGGTDRLSTAAKVEEELDLIAEVTIPRLKVDITTEDQDRKVIPKSVSDQHHAMGRLVHQVNKLKAMSVQVSTALLSSVENLVTVVADVLVDLPITENQLNDITEKIQSIRDSTVYLEEEEEEVLEMQEDGEESAEQQQESEESAEQQQESEESAEQQQQESEESAEQQQESEESAEQQQESEESAEHHDHVGGDHQQQVGGDQPEESTGSNTPSA